MAYVTRPALVPADFGYPAQEIEQPKTVKKSVKRKPAKKTKVTKKVVVKKAVAKKVIKKKGRKLPWKV